MGVSKNNGTPKSSILIGFSIIIGKVPIKTPKRCTPDLSEVPFPGCWAIDWLPRLCELPEGGSLTWELAWHDTTSEMKQVEVMKHEGLNFKPTLCIIVLYSTVRCEKPHMYTYDTGMLFHFFCERPILHLPKKNILLGEEYKKCPGWFWRPQINSQSKQRHNF